MSLWLRLYPRAWRERYGAEVEELLASEPRTLRLWLDLVAGAIDAHTNPQWTPATTPEGERPGMSTFLTCRSRRGYPARAQRASAALMLASTLLLVLLYAGLKALYGKNLMTEALLFATFNIGLLVSGLPTFLASYPLRVRVWLLALGAAGFYVFFLGVAALAAQI